MGQDFTNEGYIWVRPSDVDYNVVVSGARCKGAYNREYLAVIQGRIDTLLLKNPTVKNQIFQLL
ncbi:potassium-transporting ATPase subunit C [Flavobacterium sp. 7E]|uniref:potassium-transporting ATPase subunit C n=1 Tax=Flavobacterium sp. 7E TaxID=2735898 RepID=UPI00156F313A